MKTILLDLLTLMSNCNAKDRHNDEISRDFHAVEDFKRISLIYFKFFLVDYENDQLGQFSIINLTPK